MRGGRADAMSGSRRRYSLRAEREQAEREQAEQEQAEQELAGRAEQDAKPPV
jgi:hypothetical protein